VISDTPLDEETAEFCPGLRRAAVVLTMLGSDEAAEVCRRIDPLTARRIIRVLGNLGDVPSQERTNAAREVAARINGSDSNAGALARSLREKVLGLRGGVSELSDEASESSFERLALLDKADPNLIWRAISGETPQAIALIARHLSPANCAKLLTVMPDGTREEVVYRMANPNPPTAGALKAFARVTNSLMKVTATGGDSADANVQFVAEVIQQFNRKVAQRVINEVKTRSGELGTAIEQLIFKFTDLLKLPTASLQAVLRNTQTSDLALAVKGVPEVMRGVVFSNLSQRASAVLREEMDLLGAVPATDAERAQLEIVQVARALEGAGELSLEPGDVEYVE